MLTVNKINVGQKVVGIGAKGAFAYVTPFYFLDNYSVMCLYNRKDTQLIKKRFDVFTLEENIPNLDVPRDNQKELLKFEVSRNFINTFNSPNIFVRKSTKGVERFVNQNNLTLLANKISVKDQFENKLNFRNVLKQIGLKPIDGFSIKYKDLSYSLISNAQLRYGRRIVLQVAELTHGGGVGTGFIENRNDYEEFIKKINKLTLPPSNRKIKNVTISRYISGIQISILACVTRYGVITGSVQTQIQDIEDVLGGSKTSGAYCGHDFSHKRISEESLNKAKQIAKSFGEYLALQNYKGIFGLDLIISEDEDVYPVECNSRYTDAIPISSFLDIEKGLKPLEYYHFLEMLGYKYKINADKISRGYLKPRDFSQLLVTSKSDSWTVNSGELEAGIYRYEGDSLHFVRHTFNPLDLKNNNEFLVTDGVPNIGTKFKPQSRVLRLVFSKSILASRGKLEKDVSNTIRKIYEKLDFVDVAKK